MQPKAYQPMGPSQNMAGVQHLRAVLLTVVLMLFSSCHVTSATLKSAVQSFLPQSQACSFVPVSRLFRTVLTEAFWQCWVKADSVNLHFSEEEEAEHSSSSQGSRALSVILQGCF